MRRYFGITITVIIVIIALIALSAVGSIEFDRPPENELLPNRSSYNSGPTGTRAFYQLLEESGLQVARWRDKFSALKDEAKDATLVIIGPFPQRQRLPGEELVALQTWIASGGRAVIISRTPVEQFADPMIHAKDAQDPPDWDAPAEQIVNRKSDELIVQPTELTRNTRGLALSDFASRMKFHPPAPEETKSEEDATGTAPPPKLEPTVRSDDREQRQDSSDSSSSIPAPSASPTPVGVAETGSGAETETATEEADDEYWEAMLYAPVIHLGDKDGAVLADFTYGKGRIIFLSDPFVVANNGIARGANLTLAMNILRSRGSPEQKIFFDEYHHGYHSESNPLVNYFRGTPVPWLMLQGLLLCLLVVYTYSRRFARPMPLPQLDRHSPLEFVGSMANLQQVAQARDLAMENIYPRFKAHLCRRLGISTRATTDEIIGSARRRRLPVSENELRKTLSNAELTLAGEKIDDARLVALVSRMRRIISQIKR
jgi:hypothetical protein